MRLDPVGGEIVEFVNGTRLQVEIRDGDVALPRVARRSSRG